MADLEFIAPAKSLTVTFSLDPVQNVVADLVMLTTPDYGGFADWVKETADSFPEDVMEKTRQIIELIGHFESEEEWQSFPAWLEHVASQDPHDLRDKALESLISHAQSALGDNGDIPDRATILEDRKAYNKLMERMYEAKGKTFKEGCCDNEYDLFIDPAANHKFVVEHLRTMWEQYLEPEWERNLPLLQESVAAFETIDYSRKPVDEIAREVIDREIPDEWEWVIEEVEEFVFVPSPHIGPYIILNHNKGRMQIIFGARVPKGATISSPALNRSELVTRLNALADDTRLRILDLVSNHGEIGAQEIINELSLSQSAASRHLRQLVATGFLVEQRHEGAKFYQLNQSRVDDAFDALKDFLLD
jgi:DNA-binding transcriptional ArsR family regulator